ncbi:nucleotidyltransferase domain-containing protein [candidate division KSB1 bacterium]|nr:nucleotidyltransferase domain-containing protein [candidate division KSB1 bacterium]
MTPAEPRIPVDRAQIEAFCQKWKIIELSFFGSVLRDDFGPDSDVDVLVTFAPKDGWSVFDIMHAEQELSEIIGRRIDLVERSAVEQSRNPIRRRHILANSQRFYVAG